MVATTDNASFVFDEGGNNGYTLSDSGSSSSVIIERRDLDNSSGLYSYIPGSASVICINECIPVNSRHYAQVLELLQQFHLWLLEQLNTLNFWERLAPVWVFYEQLLDPDAPDLGPAGAPASRVFKLVRPGREYRVIG